MAVKILAVSGSMREGSRGAAALQLVLAAARNIGADTQFLDLRVLDLPIYRPKAPAPPASVAAADAVAWADALVLCSPDYHGSMSGAVKNFLDYHWKEFGGKLFAHLCTSHEKGLTVMDQMRTAVRQCYGWSLPYGVSIHADEDFDERLQLKNASLGRRLEMLARDVVVYGAMLRQQFIADFDSGADNTFAAKFRGA